VKRRGVKLREAFLAYPPARPHGRFPNPGSASQVGKSKMNFNFSLNETFPGSHNVLKIGHDLLPENCHSFTGRNFHILQQRVNDILDTMGNASARAQGLKASITSGSRLRTQSEHVAFILIDRASNDGLGSVVGLLKVGKKNLFLLDGNGGQNEVYPLCVLDFYVHESRQRSGCGKNLFEYMLQDQKATPKFMAIDRPSPKLLAFLRKYYGLAKSIPQVNNYVIFDGFFVGRPFECSPGPKRARIYMGKLQYV